MLGEPGSSVPLPFDGINGHLFGAHLGTISPAINYLAILPDNITRQMHNMYVQSGVLKPKNASSAPPPPPPPLPKPPTEEPWPLNQGTLYCELE